MEGIQQNAYHQILTPDTFFQSNWEFLHQPLQPPCSAQPLPTDGNRAIAQTVIEYFQ